MGGLEVCQGTVKFLKINTKESFLGEEEATQWTTNMRGFQKKASGC